MADFDLQEFHDRLYFEIGPCCAGCDWWRSFNSRAGECLKSAPVKPKERYAMLGIEGASMRLVGGHVFTPARHHCGDFKDEFDWAGLPLGYRKRIGEVAHE